VAQIARRLERSPAQVALNWITKRPGVVSTIIGATKLERLRDNLRALDFDIPAEIAARLDETSRPELVHPYTFFQPYMRAMLTGGTQVSERPAWDR
jgi:aryl-alcohol dehydrogenase-like predicted oxidoreductase